MKMFLLTQLQYIFYDFNELNTYCFSSAIVFFSIWTLLVLFIGLGQLSLVSILFLFEANMFTPIAFLVSIGVSELSSIFYLLNAIAMEAVVGISIAVLFIKNWKFKNFSNHELLESGFNPIRLSFSLSWSSLIIVLLAVFKYSMSVSLNAHWLKPIQEVLVLYFLNYDLEKLFLDALRLLYTAFSQIYSSYYSFRLHSDNRGFLYSLNFTTEFLNIKNEEFGLFANSLNRIDFKKNKILIRESPLKKKNIFKRLSAKDSSLHKNRLFLIKNYKKNNPNNIFLNRNTTNFSLMRSKTKNNSYFLDYFRSAYSYIINFFIPLNYNKKYQLLSSNYFNKSILLLPSKVNQKRVFWSNMDNGIYNKLFNDFLKTDTVYYLDRTSKFKIFNSIDKEILLTERLPWFLSDDVEEDPLYTKTELIINTIQYSDTKVPFNKSFSEKEVFKNNKLNKDIIKMPLIDKIYERIHDRVFHKKLRDVGDFGSRRTFFLKRSGNVNRELNQPSSVFLYNNKGNWLKNGLHSHNSQNLDSRLFIKKTNEVLANNNIWLSGYYEPIVQPERLLSYYIASGKKSNYIKKILSGSLIKDYIYQRGKKEPKSFLDLHSTSSSNTYKKNILKTNPYDIDSSLDKPVFLENRHKKVQFNPIDRLSGLKYKKKQGFYSYYFKNLKKATNPFIFDQYSTKKYNIGNRRLKLKIIPNNSPGTFRDLTKVSTYHPTTVYGLVWDSYLSGIYGTDSKFIDFKTKTTKKENSKSVPYSSSKEFFKNIEYELEPDLRYRLTTEDRIRKSIFSNNLRNLDFQINLNSEDIKWSKKMIYNKKSIIYDILENDKIFKNTINSKYFLNTTLDGFKNQKLKGIDNLPYKKKLSNPSTYRDVESTGFNWNKIKNDSLIPLGNRNWIFLNEEPSYKSIYKRFENNLSVGTVSEQYSNNPYLYEKPYKTSLNDNFFYKKLNSNSNNFLLTSRYNIHFNKISFLKNYREESEIINSIPHISYSPYIDISQKKVKALDFGLGFYKKSSSTYPFFYFKKKFSKYVRSGMHTRKLNYSSFIEKKSKAILQTNLNQNSTILKQVPISTKGYFFFNENQRHKTNKVRPLDNFYSRGVVNYKQLNKNYLKLENIKIFNESYPIKNVVISSNHLQICIKRNTQPSTQILIKNSGIIPTPKNRDFISKEIIKYYFFLSRIVSKDRIFEDSKRVYTTIRLNVFKLKIRFYLSHTYAAITYIFLLKYFLWIRIAFKYLLVVCNFNI